MPSSLLAFLIVGAGGAGGAIARYGLTLATIRLSQTVPIGTLLSNVLGCLVMGGIVQMLARLSWFAEGGLITDHNRLLFGVGFCGAFTTLSALVFEMSTMLQRGQVALAFAYLSVTLLGGFAAFALGAWMVRTYVGGAGA
ncbi:MAG: CrcB family protein [Pseudomonadota bacterium]